jgi:hypothetical protein
MKIINATHEGKMGGGCEAIDIHFDNGYSVGGAETVGRRAGRRIILVRTPRAGAGREANEGRPSRPFFLISGAAAN